MSLRCQKSYNRHRWQVQGDSIVCFRCGAHRNPKAGKVKITPRKSKGDAK